MGYKEQIIDKMGFCQDIANANTTQHEAFTYTIVGSPWVTIAIDVSLYHEIGIIATADAVNVAAAVDVVLECNDTHLTGDGGWTGTGITFQRAGATDGVMTGTVAGNTWTAASVAADNLLFDAIKTELLPVSGNGLPSRYVRLRITAAADTVCSASIFSTRADYLNDDNWGDTPAE